MIRNNLYGYYDQRSHDGHASILNKSKKKTCQNKMPIRVYQLHEGEARNRTITVLCACRGHISVSVRLQDQTVPKTVKESEKTM